MYFQTLAMAPASCHRSARRPPKLPRTNHPPAVSTLSLLGFDLLMYQSLYMYVYIHIDVRVCACMHTTPYHTISLHCNTLHYTTLQRHYIIYITCIHAYRHTCIHAYSHAYMHTCNTCNTSNTVQHNTNTIQYIHTKASKVSLKHHVTCHALSCPLSRPLSRLCHSPLPPVTHPVTHHITPAVMPLSRP